MNQYFKRLAQNFRVRVLLRPRTGQTVLIRDVLDSSPLFQRKQRAYVAYAIPLVILDLITMAGTTELVWNHWTREVKVVDEFFSTKDQPVIRTEREPYPIPYRLGLLMAHNMFGTLIAVHLLRARFRSIRTLAFLPSRTLAKGHKTPPSIVMQCAYHSRAMGIMFPVQNCLLQDIGTPGRLEILVNGEIDGWWMDLNRGALYNNKPLPRESIHAALIQAWVSLKKDEYNGPLSPDELERALDSYSHQTRTKYQ